MTSNLGPNGPIDKTSSKGKRRLKGTPKKLKMDVQNVPTTVTDNQRNRSNPLCFENNSNLCFFECSCSRFIIVVIFSRSC